MIFVSVLAFVFVLNLVVKDKTYSSEENRVFQKAPAFSPAAYLSGRYENKMDKYATDQFVARDFFIKVKSAGDITMGKLDSNGVFRCRNNYLMEDIVTPAEKDVKADLDALKAFHKKYKSKKMYFLLAPTSGNILSEYLPLSVSMRDQNADMDSFFKSIKKIGIKPVDVRKALIKEKKDKQIYYRTDHHWTTDGAYTAFKEAKKAMKLKSDAEYKAYPVKNDFVGTLKSKSGFTNGQNDQIKIYLPKDPKKHLESVIHYNDTKEKTTNFYELGNLKKKDAYTVFGGTNHSLYTVSTPTKKARNLLVIKDSYANCFIPFLTQDYRTITVVDPRYYYENIATVMKVNEVDEVLFLYNANTFFSDNYLRMMLINK